MAKKQEEKKIVEQEVQERRVIVAEETLVPVTPKFTGKRFIAGQWYNFKKDKEIKVPREVKRVLLEADAIYR